MIASELSDRSVEFSLRRSPANEPSRVLGGACAELARRLNAPVTFLRALVLVGAFLSSDVFFAYLALVLLIPRRGRSLPGAANVLGALRVGLLVAVFQVTLSGSLGVNDVLNQSPAIWIPEAGLCLVTLVALLVSGPERDGPDRALAAAALAVLAVAAALVLGMMAVPGIRWERAASAAGVLLGVALVLRGRRGDGRALLLPAVIAASGLLLLTASGARLQGGIGRLDVRPVSVRAMPLAYRRAIGSLHVDLSQLRSSNHVVTVALSVGVGHIDVTVPGGAGVALDARVGRGTIFPPDARPVTGFGIHRRRTYLPTPPPLRSRHTFTLRITADVGIGTVAIDRPGEGPDD